MANEPAQIQVSGISVFAQANIQSLMDPAEQIIPNTLGFLPSLEGQRRIALSFTIVDAFNDPHLVDVIIDYRDEMFEQTPIVGTQNPQQGGA